MSESTTPHASGWVVRLKGVHQRYGQVEALAGIDLDIPEGRMVGLIGPDGVGKSSLMALISGARKIQEGSVEVLGGDMAQRRHREAVCPRVADRKSTRLNSSHGYISYAVFC